MDEYDEIYGDYGGDAPDAVAQQSQPQHGAAQPTSQQQEADPPGPPPGGPGEEDDADEFLVTLNEPEAKPAADADDEFEVQLDDTAAEGPGGPPSGAPPPQAGGFRYARPGVPPAPRPEGGPRPYMDATSSSAQPAAPWASGGGGRGTLGGGRGLGTRPWRPQFIPLSATALEKDDTLAFPEAAKPGQMIKLPGQTRVTPDEYHEFITLGQGGVYELDMDRVLDAPWKVPGTETSAFFNYSLTPAKWRAYVREIQQAHAELRMQGRIQLYDPPSSMARDPDMPPELVAALAGKGTTGSSYFGEPRPPSATQTMRQDAPDAILLLAGNVQ